MVAHLPTEVTLEERPDGIGYRLPPRQLGQYHLVGLAIFTFGLVLCSTLVISTWKLVQALMSPGKYPDDSGFLWLGACIISLLLFRAGLYVLPVGLFIFAGHSEIELRGRTLYARECCGPVGWTWQRSTEDLRRFFVSEGLEPLNYFGKVSIGPLRTHGVITPEWKPVVGGEATKSMWLAPGYPRAWLQALAEDLARHCPNVAVEPTITKGESAPSLHPIPVLQKEPDFSEFEELTERPAGSAIKLEESLQGLTLTIPPAGVGYRLGLLIGGLFVCFVAFGISANAFAENDGDNSLITTVAFAAVAWSAGIALLVMGVIRGRRGRTKLAVLDDSLIVRQKNLFGRENRWEWPRQQVADVFVMHHLDSEGPDHWDLRIHPNEGLGSPLTLLPYRDPAELRWIATLLRHALDCPGHANSPQPGFVVQSPKLLLRLGRQGQ